MKPAVRRMPLGLPGTRTIVMGLLVAILVGVQLGAMPYRYRKQIWQLQGGAIGVVIGYLLGRLSRSARE